VRDGLSEDIGHESRVKGSNPRKRCFRRRRSGEEEAAVAPKGGGRGGKKGLGGQEAVAQIEGLADGLNAASPKGETADVLA
jgi:hypothetical protein